MLPNLHKWLKKRHKRMMRKLKLNKAPHRHRELPSNPRLLPIK